MTNSKLKKASIISKINLPNVSGYLIIIVLLITISSCSSQNSKKEERLYRIYDGKNYGFIDTSGKIIIKPNLTYTASFQEDLALLVNTVPEDPIYYFINRKGDTVLRPSPFILTSIPEDMYQFSGLKGEVNKSYQKELSFAANEFSYSSGLALIYDQIKDRFGYMDKLGKVFIHPQYLNATKFYNGYAIVQTSFDSSNWENTHVGIIDSSGKMIIPDKYFRLTLFASGLAIGTMTTKKSDGSYTFTSLLLNKNGKVINTVLPGFICLYNNYSGSYTTVYNGLYANFYNAPYGIVDSSGNILKNKQNGQDLYFKDVIINKGKYFWVKQKDKYQWFTLDQNENIKVVDTKLYDTVKTGFNNEGIACVKFANSDGNAEYGFIDTLGKFLIPPKYKSASNFRGPLAPASLQSGSITIDGYINKQGVFVWSREIRESN